jgi:membrane protease YdiL (CAAX protease family)
MMEIVQYLGMTIVAPLALLALLHFKIGKYPLPVSLGEDKRQAVIEVLAFFALNVVFISALIAAGWVEKIQAPTVGILVQFVSMAVIPYILIPTLYMKLVHKWTFKDFGFCNIGPNSRGVIIFAALLYGSEGLALFDSGFTPMPVMMIVFAILQPAIFEEFLFRGVIQTRLQRVLGQNKALIGAAVLFGLAHFSVNIFMADLDLLMSSLKMVKQAAFGCIFGIIYMKTGSLWPGIIAHFLADGRLPSLMVAIF